MRQAYYLDDPYCFELETSVAFVDGSELVLDRTCMYPGGGGQPPDAGTISLASGEIIRIHTVTKSEDGAIRHHCQELLAAVVVGSMCTVRLDADRRLALMRHHTALHVFNTVMLRDFDGWITGVGIGPDESHIDFKVDNYSVGMRAHLEKSANDILRRNLNVKSYFISEAEFRQRPDLLRTLEAAPPIEGGVVRVVEIEGFESQACGGTHVRNTEEVGMLSIRKVDNKGRQNRRFYITLSPRA
jgi:misacylated tRNA(Ala) deacylase